MLSTQKEEKNLDCFLLAFNKKTNKTILIIPKLTK